MYRVFLVCFLAGGTIMALQFVLSLLGLGSQDGGIDGGHDLPDTGGHDGVGHDVAGHDVAGHDGHHHHGAHVDSGGWLIGVLSFRTMVAALTFFGLAGLAANSAHLAPALCLAIALAAGLGAMFVVAWVMRSLARLQSEGTARIERAVGQSGTVYLSVPGHRAGAGKVHLNLQNRTFECRAITSADALPTGTKVVVTAVVGRDTVEVAPAP